MTQKHYVAVAKIIKEARVIAGDLGSMEEDIAAENMRAKIARELAEYFRVEGGFDVNGNRKFKRDRFMSACEVSE